MATISKRAGIRILCLLSVIAEACAYNDLAIPEIPLYTCDSQSSVSWASQVKPLLITYCAKPGCHVQGSSRDFFSSYEMVRYFSGDIKIEVANRSMPLDRQLNQDEINIIVCWIDDGAQEN